MTRRTRQTEAARGTGAYDPDLSRRRRQFTRQPNAIAWLLPVIALVVMLAAVLHLVPDLSTTPKDFGRSYAAAHEQAVRKLRPASVASIRVQTDAESVATRLRLTSGLAARAQAAGATLLAARESDANYEHQLQLVIRIGAGDPISLFQERFAPRALDTYRRIDVDSLRLYIATAVVKGRSDSVLVWTEPRMILTLVGAAAESTFVNFAARLDRTRML
jgi:hypothetical protein